MSTRASKRQDPVGEGEMLRMAQEIKSLARQVAALRELVQQCINGERPANRENATQQGTHTAQDREMSEECSRAEERGVLLAKNNTLRPAPSARAEEASHPKAAKNTDTWAKVVGREEKEAARRKAKQEAQQKAPTREQQPRKRRGTGRAPACNRRGSNPKNRGPGNSRPNLSGMRPRRGHGNSRMIALAGHIIQADINHSASAQDLLLQAMAVLGLGVAVVAEPYRILQNNCVGNQTGTVMLLRAGTAASPAINIIDSGQGYVAAAWGKVTVVGLYASPNAPISSLQRILDRIRNCVVSLKNQDVLLLGNFNAKSTLWGSPRTNTRSEAVVEWAAELDPRLLNEGQEQEYLRPLAGGVHRRPDMGLPDSGPQSKKLESGGGARVT